MFIGHATPDRARAYARVILWRAAERVPTRSEEMQQNRLIIPYLYIEK